MQEKHQKVRKKSRRGHGRCREGFRSDAPVAKVALVEVANKCVLEEEAVLGARGSTACTSWESVEVTHSEELYRIFTKFVRQSSPGRDCLTCVAAV